MLHSVRTDSIFHVLTLRTHNRFWTTAVLASALAFVTAVDPPLLSGQQEQAALHERGAEIYRTLCAQCHGANGEGVEGEYDKPLYGDRPLDRLADLIERTMPEDEPELCVGDDAAAVSAYIYDAFYSPAAQGNPPDILPARLTNRQYQESIADLIGSFTSNLPDEGPEDQERRHGPSDDDSVPDEIKNAREGLRADYFQSDGMNKKDKRSIQRIDRFVDFDFGEGSPGENISPEQFSIAWSGSIIARETGVHEFRVRTPNGARLYVNADLQPGDANYRDDSSAPSQTPLIDAWVSSGEMREETGRVLLLGGRRYLIRLDFFKYKEKVSSIRLEWKPPHGDWGIPTDSDFAPTMVSRVAVVNSPFPADDRSLGYERGAAVSKEWFNAVTAGAIEVATEVDNRLDSLTHSQSDGGDRLEKLRTFANRFVSLAFRRPLTAAQQRTFVDTKFETAETPDQAVKRVVLFALLSPEFLFPGLNDRESPDAFDVASRLAMELWDSLPDETLLNVAASGGLDDMAGVREQVLRMTDDPRSRSKMLSFFHHWFEMDGERDLLKDDQVYPQFNHGIIADLRHSLNLLVEDVVWSEKSDYRQLLLADSLFLNDRLALLYGNADSGEPTEGFRRVTFDPKERSGVLTHPYLLSAFAYHNNSSPIHRGVFLTRNIVGRPLKPPPVAIEFKDGEFDRSLTMREKVTQVTKDNACMSCHSIINPLGFSLEEFDAIGRLRKEDNSKPVDTTSDYMTDSGEKVTFTGARDVAVHAAESPAAHQAFVNHLFHYTVKQPISAYGKHIPGQLRAQFEKNAFNIRDLFAEIVTVSAVERTTLETQARRSKYRQSKVHPASLHPENL